jgi:hypothetical protein
MKDLVLLVADKNAHFALQGALSRPEALGIRNISFEFRVHPGRDGGARKNGPELLALEKYRFHHALLVLDFEGSGANLKRATELEAQLDQRLARDWRDAAKSIVITPELDVWIWGADYFVERAIEWPGDRKLREWLQRHGFDFDANGKPRRPKEALEAALRVSALPRSSALYGNIASKISLRRCGDEAFLRLCHQLQKWFPR